MLLKKSKLRTSIGKGRLSLIATSEYKEAKSSSRNMSISIISVKYDAIQ